LSHHRGHDAAITSLVATTDGRRAATVARDGVVMLWRLDTDLSPTEVVRGDTVIGAWISASLNGHALAKVHDRAWLFDMYSGRTLLAIPRESSAITGSALSRSGRLLAIARVRGTLDVLDAATGARLDALTINANGVSQLSFSNDESLLAVALHDQGRILIRDVRNARWLGETDLAARPCEVMFIEGDDLLVQDDVQGLFRLQIGAMNTGGSAALFNRPGRWTSACLTTQQRMELVGQPALEARTRSFLCELAYGRFDRALHELGVPDRH
jgi:WD40 repeat protein